MYSKFISPNLKDPLPLASCGKGVYLYDEHNNMILDACSGAMTVNLGHGNEEIIKAIMKQMEVLTFTYRSQFTNEPLEKLCQKIASKAPGSLEMVSLANSGSEAAELAMKLAYMYWKAYGKPTKHRIISRWNSYHGSTIGALSMSGNPSRRREYSTYLSDYPMLELPFCHRCPYEKTYTDCGLFCARQLQKIINRLGADTISAVICEPITGASGAGINPPEGYFSMINDICKKNDILFIMDEVITGFGRTGKFFASEHWNIEPDIIVFGKGVSSGFCPLSGIIADKNIYETIIKKNMAFSTGHTFGGNPLASAGAIGVMEYIDNHQIVNQTREKGLLFEKKLYELKTKYHIVDDVRGKGLLWGIEFATRDGAPFEADLNLTSRIVKLCFKNGLLVYPSSGFIDGILGDSILLSPPLTITDKEIEVLFQLLDKSISDMEGEL